MNGQTTGWPVHSKKQSRSYNYGQEDRLPGLNYNVSIELIREQSLGMQIPAH